MDLSAIFATFGMCSIFFAIGCYLNELCIYWEDRNKFEFLQKILAFLGVILLIFSLPAVIVYWPLETLTLRRMEKCWRKEERESAKKFFQAETNRAVRTAVEEEHARLVEFYEDEMLRRIDKAEEKLQKRFTAKCLSCPFREKEAPRE